MGKHWALRVRRIASPQNCSETPHTSRPLLHIFTRLMYLKLCTVTLVAVEIVQTAFRLTLTCDLPNSQREFMFDLNTSSGVCDHEFQALITCQLHQGTLSSNGLAFALSKAGWEGSR
jgi:hypothetical protein